MIRLLASHKGADTLRDRMGAATRQLVATLGDRNGVRFGGGVLGVPNADSREVDGDDDTAGVKDPDIFALAAAAVAEGFGVGPLLARVDRLAGLVVEEDPTRVRISGRTRNGVVVGEEIAVVVRGHEPEAGQGPQKFTVVGVDAHEGILGTAGGVGLACADVRHGDAIVGADDVGLQGGLGEALGGPNGFAGRVDTDKVFVAEDGEYADQRTAKHGSVGTTSTPSRYTANNFWSPVVAITASSSASLSPSPAPSLPSSGGTAMRVIVLAVRSSAREVLYFAPTEDRQARQKESRWR